MKKVLCFGDSNTYGFIPETMERYDINHRWTGILKQLAKDNFEIVVAGCNNRTAFQDNPKGIEFTGYKVLPKYLDNTYDIVILSIGINDVQKIYDTDEDTIKNGIENLISLTKKLCPKSKIILISPARLSNDVLNHYYFSQLFDENSVKKSLLFSEIYRNAANNNGCLFFDWDKTVKVSNVDGLHFSEESHKKIAETMYNFLCASFPF